MLFKILFLIAAIKLHDVKAEALKPTLLYCVPILLISLVTGVPFLSLLIGGIITFCVTYIYFGLLTKFNSGVEYFAIMGLGALVLVLFI